MKPLFAVCLALFIIQNAIAQVSNPPRVASACADFYNYITQNDSPELGLGGLAPGSLRDRVDKVLAKIVGEASLSTDHKSGTPAQVVGDFYVSGMDLEQRKASGYSALALDLMRISDLESVDQLIDLIIDYHAEGLPMVFRPLVFKHVGGEHTQLFYVLQGGLAIGRAGFYLDDNRSARKARKRYRKYIASLFRLTGSKKSDAKARASNVLALETALAAAWLPLASMREPADFLNELAVAEADKITPGFLWSVYFSRLGLGELKNFSLAHEGFMRRVDELLVEVPLAHWQDYLSWQILHISAPFLSPEFVHANERFRFGRKSNLSDSVTLALRVLGQTNQLLGKALGQLYVKNELAPSTREAARSMARDLKAQLRKSLENKHLDDVGQSQKDLAALAAMRINMAYPLSWPDYSNLNISRTGYWKNMRAVRAWSQSRQFARLHQANPEARWDIRPQDLNAFHNRVTGEVAYPAALLQPPIFDPTGDKVGNFGALGTIIAHELFHGLMNRQGFVAESQYRALQRQLELRKYQLPATEQRDFLFDELLADFYGLTLAWQAFMDDSSETADLSDAEQTAARRFFSAWAYAWTGAEKGRSGKAGGRHPENKQRVNLPLANLEAFQSAYGCQAGDPMVLTPQLRLRPW